MTTAVTTYPTAVRRADKLRQVYEGRAHRTTGGLTKSDLTVNKRGRVVSRRASAAAKRSFRKDAARRAAFKAMQF